MPAKTKRIISKRPRNPKACFLGLATEIREEIYAFVFAPPTKNSAPYNNVLVAKSDRNRKKHAILRANKQIYAEAVEILYKTQTFQFTCRRGGITTIRPRFRLRLETMRHVVLKYVYKTYTSRERMDQNIAPFLQMVLDRCPSLRTLTLCLRPDFDQGYHASYEVPRILQDTESFEHTTTALECLMTKVKDYVAIVALGNNYPFAHRDTRLPFAPHVQWEGKNLERWFPPYGSLDDLRLGRSGRVELWEEVVRTWIFSAKGWSTMEWLERNRRDFERLARV